MNRRLSSARFSSLIECFSLARKFGTIENVRHRYRGEFETTSKDTYRRNANTRAIMLIPRVIYRPYVTPKQTRRVTKLISIRGDGGTREIARKWLEIEKNLGWIDLRVSGKAQIAPTPNPLLRGTFYPPDRTHISNYLCSIDS